MTRSCICVCGWCTYTCGLGGSLYVSVTVHFVYLCMFFITRPITQRLSFCCLGNVETVLWYKSQDLCEKLSIQNQTSCQNSIDLAFSRSPLWSERFQPIPHHTAIVMFLNLLLWCSDHQKGDRGLQNAPVWNHQLTKLEWIRESIPYMI